MYKPPIEIIMKEVRQKMDEGFENAVFKAVRKVDINVDKEELLKALIYDRGQYDKGYEDAMNDVKHPQPLKFEELHENMWVFDTYIKCAIYITKIENNCINSEYERFDNPIKHELFCNICGENENQTYFEEERFYPITIPNIGDKNG